MEPSAPSKLPECEPAHLTRVYCQERQERLVEQLKSLALDAALLMDRRHVHYFSGHWNPGQKTSVGLLIPTKGRTVLVAAQANHPRICADIQRAYASTRCGTLVDDQDEAMLAALGSDIQGMRCVGCDRSVGQYGFWECASLRDVLLALRRKKYEDEINLLRRGIAGCEAAYRCARKILRPGLSEIELYAQIQAAAVTEVGEPIGEFGNDFQIGTLGGPPRARAAKAGEVAILDLSVIVRGYSSDMCRTFSVDGHSTAIQRQAHDRLAEALAYIESHALPGVSCRALFEEVHGMLDGHHGWRFFHHLGHGIGLSPHEAPRLSPSWNDTLQIGDVFTAEPGLYGDDLHQGVRIENIYHVKQDGLERLTNFPTDLNS